MNNLAVAIVTNYRCTELLSEIIRAWFGRGISVIIVRNNDPQEFGNDVTTSIRKASDAPYVLVGGDDLLPVGEWPDEWPGTPGTIQAVRTLDVEGRRWFDWARWKGDGTLGSNGGLRGLQSYDSPETPETYISGNSQVWSREAIEVARWPGAFGDCTDVKACRIAQAAGIKLLPPPPGGPTVIHLERRYFDGFGEA